jgi:starch synthase
VRVLFVNENVGGHRTLHAHLRRAVAASADVEATFLDVPPPGLPRKLAAAPVPGLARLDADLQPLRLQLAQSAWTRRRLPAALADADVVHVYTHNAVLLSARALRGVPTVVGLDGTNRQNAYTLPYREPTGATPVTVAATRPFERRVYEAATMLVARSEWAADSLRDDYGVEAGRIRVVPMGMAVPPVRERRATDPPEITFVGTTMARKGGWQLLRVFRERLRGRCVLNLVTTDAVPAEPGVRVFADVRSGDGRVEELLARTAVFALPSEIDKSSWAVLEAMAAGVPVVTTTTGGLPELVGDTGVVVPPGDDERLADALTGLLDDPARRDALGRKARRRVEEHFDARRTTAVLLDVLREARDRFRS